jgi:nucleoside phosphorylase
VLATALMVILVGSTAFAGATRAADAAGRSSCGSLTLVLSAMPVELGPLLGEEKIAATVAVDGHDYYVGRLRGHDVVLALTGIGPVNATRATEAALAHFRCGARPGIGAVVFSGVAGGDYIGNVTVPTRWTLDAGRHFLGVDPQMLAAARRVARQHVALEQKAPAGDPACGCVTNPDLVATVSVTHAPRIEVGGDGQTTDPFSGRALPCVPGGGDVLGCEPCPAQKNLARDAQGFGSGVAPFVDPAFFTGYFASTATGPGTYVAEDEETAAVDAVASAHRVPFLGVRAVSDGGGDPLGLPGFPVQFFYYRQLAADNAAATTLAFLSGWSARRG